MLKRLLRWNLKRRQMKFARSTPFAQDNRKRRRFKLTKRPDSFSFNSNSFYSYEKPARRPFFRYGLVGVAVLALAVWFFMETARGWDLFRV